MGEVGWSTSPSLYEVAPQLIVYYRHNERRGTNEEI